MKSVRSPESEVRSPDGVIEVQTPGRSSRLGHRTLLISIVAGGLLCLYPLQQSIDKQTRLGSRPTRGTHFLPSEAKLSRLSGGYSGLLAAIYWTRAVQYYGRHRLAHAKEFALLGTLLDITTNLDPHLLIAYRFGSLFLGGKAAGRRGGSAASHLPAGTRDRRQSGLLASVGGFGVHLLLGHEGLRARGQGISDGKRAARRAALDARARCVGCGAGWRDSNLAHPLDGNCPHGRERFHPPQRGNSPCRP